MPAKAIIILSYTLCISSWSNQIGVVIYLAKYSFLGVHAYKAFNIIHISQHFETRKRKGKIIYIQNKNLIKQSNYSYTFSSLGK